MDRWRRRRRWIEGAAGGQARFIDVLRLRPKMHACSWHKVVVRHFSGGRLTLVVLPGDFICEPGAVRDFLRLIDVREPLFAFHLKLYECVCRSGGRGGLVGDVLNVLVGSLVCSFYGVFFD